MSEESGDAEAHGLSLHIKKLTAVCKDLQKCALDVHIMVL